jgi:hypothetical protein
MKNYSYCSQKLCMQQDVVAAFLASFQLSLAEQAILRGSSREAAVTDEFFRVLERVQNIHSNCRMLMQSGHQTAALEIMEQMALYQVCPFINLTKLKSFVCVPCWCVHAYWFLCASVFSSLPS